MNPQSAFKLEFTYDQLYALERILQRDCIHHTKNKSEGILKECELSLQISEHVEKLINSYEKEIREQLKSELTHRHAI